MPLSGTSEFLDFLSHRNFLPVDKQVKEMHGNEVTEDFFVRNGFRKPIMVRHKKSLRIIVPEPNFTVEDVARSLGHDYQIDVIDVLKQDQFKMPVGDFLKFFQEKEPRSRRLNVLSLEISRSRMAHLVEPPYVIKEMSLVEKLWPSDDSYFNIPKPSVQKYCLMSMKDSWTDFHIDFGGSSVWYHMLWGRKIFYLIPPRRRYIKEYTHWMGEFNNRMLFFPDQINKFSDMGVPEVYKLEIKTGETILLPAGWIHAVHTLEDSMVFGGNFLHSLSVPIQLKIYKLEKQLRTEDRFLFPYFEKLHWYVAQYILHKLEGNLAHNIPPIRPILKGALKLLEVLPQWLNNYSTVSREERRYNFPSKRDMQWSLVDLIRRLNDVVRSLIMTHFENVTSSTKQSLSHSHRSQELPSSSLTSSCHSPSTSSFNSSNYLKRRSSENSEFFEQKKPTKGL